VEPPYRITVPVGVEDVGAVEAHVVPLDVRTLPDVPGATEEMALVPLPTSTAFAVRVAAPVPPLPTGRVPVTPVERGRPVTLVITPEAGVPSAGVTSVGAVSVLFVRVSVVARPTSVSVLVGSVKVPVFVIVPMTGDVSVLLVKVCASVVPTITPDGPVITAAVPKPRFVLAEDTLATSERLFALSIAPDDDA
jgi:hypothetical protein